LYAEEVTQVVNDLIMALAFRDILQCITLAILGFQSASLGIFETVE
jgi:hypothetical protein